MRTVLRRPDFRLLFLGLVASMIGESILLVALAIWVKDLTGSDGMAGATLFAVAAPMLLAPVIGWVVDRFRRRPFLVVANLATAVLLAPLFLVRDRADVGIIYVVAVGYGLSIIAVGGALGGLIKILVPEELLADANGALQTVKQGLRLVGPLLGAGLYSGFGGWALAAVGATGFVVAASAILALRVAEAGVARASGGGIAAWRDEVAAGVRHLVGQAAIRRTVVGISIGVLVIGFFESIIFAYVDRGLGRPPTFVGVLLTLQGIGGLLGGLVAARAVRRLGEIGTVAVGVLAMSLTCVGMTYPQVALGFAANVVAGVGLPLVIVGFVTILQRHTPAELMGRVSASADALISIPQALSIAVGAILVSIVDYRLLFVVMAVGLALASLYLWAGRSLSSPAAAGPGLSTQEAEGRAISGVPTPREAESRVEQP